MPKKGSGGQAQPWQMGQQFQVPGQMPTYQQTQPVGQPQAVGQPHIPQHYGDVNGGVNPYTGDGHFFQRIAQQRAAGQHPMLSMMLQRWGG